MDFSIISLSIRDKRVYEALLAIPNSSLRAVAETTNINRGTSMNLLKACAQLDSSTALLRASSCATAPKIQPFWQKFYARSSKLCR